MKRLRRFFCFFLFFLFLSVAAAFGVDYSQKENWAIAETGKTETTFDLFYIYPTLAASGPGGLMDWRDPELADKIVSFSRAQTGIFGPEARVFAPYVRQAAYDACIAGLKRTPVDLSACRIGMEDSVEAFRHYWKTWRKEGRPLILLGHSQGAIDLHFVLTQCRELSVENGFVAAYLPGFPGAMTARKFSDEFAGRGFRSPGVGSDRIEEDAFGVLLFWNTQSRDAEPSPFRFPNSLVVNPLNWSSTQSAPASANSGAYLYDYRTKSAKTVPNFCGAEPDPAGGVLIVSLPANSEWDAYGFMGKGVFHQNDIWFFAENLARNAKMRAERWLRERAVPAGKSGGTHSP